MFERYTEKARRIIFFARFEASQLGAQSIETEHLLLGWLREDKPLASRLIGNEDARESIRAQAEAHAAAAQPPVGTSVDLPLSHESKRVLAFGAEEAERLSSPHIDSIHLVLGILREQNCLAARLLTERQVRLAHVRGLAALAVDSNPRQALRAVAPEFGTYEVPPALAEWLSEQATRSGVIVVTNDFVAGFPVDAAIYEPPAESRPEVARLREKLRVAVQAMEAAIGNHQFEQARACAEQERQLRQELRELTASGQNPPPDIPAVPFLCILVLFGDESFRGLRSCVESCLQEGVTEVWLLESLVWRAYTATRGAGLCEVVSGRLRIDVPRRLELDIRRFFS